MSYHACAEGLIYIYVLHENINLYIGLKPCLISESPFDKSFVGGILAVLAALVV